MSGEPPPSTTRVEGTSLEVKRTTGQKATTVAGWLLAAAMTALQGWGYLTQEQADKINKAVVQPSAAHAPQAIKSDVVKNSVGAMTKDELVVLIRKIIESIQPQVEPAPPPVVPDTDVLPINNGLSILVCDDTGLPITLPEIASGKLFRVSATGAAGKIGWQPVKSGPVKISASTDGTEYTGYLVAGQWVEFGLTDFGSGKQLSMRVSCNEAPRPPPVEPPEPSPSPPIVPVDPDVAPTPPGPLKAILVDLVVVCDTKHPNPDTAIVLNATDRWDEFTAAGNSWRFVDFKDTTALGLKSKEDLDGDAVPRLLVYDKATKELIRSLPLPSMAEIQALVSGYNGGKP